MKSFVIAAVLCSSLAFVYSAPAATQSLGEKLKKAAQECNATIPVQKNPIDVIGQGVFDGEPIALTQQEKCFLKCCLEKSEILDENANVKNPEEFINLTLSDFPFLANYSDVIIAQILEIKTMSKEFENDKCQKAFVFWHQFVTDQVTLIIAKGLQEKDKSLVEEVREYFNYNKSVASNIGKAKPTQVASVHSSPAATLSYYEKKEKAAQECNVTIPVQKNPINVIGQSVLDGKPIALTQQEKCFLKCYLEKLGDLDENANVKNPEEFINLTLSINPFVIANDSEVIMAAQIFQIQRTSKAFDNDKCQKAFVFWKQFVTNYVTLIAAGGLQEKDMSMVEKVREYLNDNKSVVSNVGKAKPT